jgi:hypothetical protein
VYVWKLVIRYGSVGLTVGTGICDGLVAGRLFWDAGHLENCIGVVGGLDIARSICLPVKSASIDLLNQCCFGVVSSPALQDPEKAESSGLR